MAVARSTELRILRMWHLLPANIMRLGRSSAAAVITGVALRPFSRRTLLATGVQGLIGASLGAAVGVRPARAQAPAARPALTDLGKGFRVLSLGETNVLAATDSTGTALVDGAPVGRAASLTGAARDRPAGRQSPHAVQHALASRADGLERILGAGGRRDRRAGEHEALVDDRRHVAVERRNGRAVAEGRATEQNVL